MADKLATRRRHLHSMGRPMTLRRIVSSDPATYSDLPVVGKDRSYEPGEIQGGIQQGDLMVDLLNDEIAAADWSRPSRPDRVLIDGRTYTVQGAWPVNDGPLCIGWRVWVRG